MLRRHWLHCVCAAPLWPLGACTQNLPLRLGTNPWIGTEPLLLAHDFKWLAPGVQIHAAPSARDSLAGLREGRLDAAMLTLDETLTARADGVPLTAVLVLDTSSGADVLLARPGIATLAALRGQRLAVERSAVGGLMLVQALAAAGLTTDELTVLEMPLDDHPRAAQDRHIDAAISYEPTATRLQRLGWQRLFDSRAIPDTIFDVLAVRRDRMSGRRGAIESAVTGHFRGLAHLRINRPDATYRIASRNDIQPIEVTQALAGVALPDLPQNRTPLAPSARMTAASQALNELMVRRHLLPRADPLDQLFDASYLPDREPPP